LRFFFGEGWYRGLVVDGISLKKNIIAARNGLSVAERECKSEQILSTLLSLDILTTVDTIFVYINFRSEVQTRHLIATLLRMGKRIVVPVTLAQERRLLAVTINNVDQDCVPGFCSIPEPRPELWGNQQVAGRDIEAILLPGSVFDERCGRWGYGGGYYDRFLANEAPQAIRIALAFDLQIVKQLSLQPHDQLMDIIVTEKRVLRRE
jgi:5-formyltetrahydrofolate cyclo-ligase